MKNDNKSSRSDCQADTLKLDPHLGQQKAEIACQADTFESGSAPMPRVIDLTRRAREYTRRHGVLATFGKLVRFLSGAQGDVKPGSNLTPFSAVGEPTNGKKKSRPEEVLSLQAGEYIEVKSEEEILKTLDEEGKLNGLTYIPAMREFCGRRFKVFKRMETMYQEESGKVRKLKNTVLLEGVHCDGMLMKCDRACFFFWREGWLRRVDRLKPDLIKISNGRDVNGA